MPPHGSEVFPRRFSPSNTVLDINFLFFLTQDVPAGFYISVLHQSESAMWMQALPAFPLFFESILLYYRENIPDIQRKPDGLPPGGFRRCPLQRDQLEKEAMA